MGQRNIVTLLIMYQVVEDRNINYVFNMSIRRLNKRKKFEVGLIKLTLFSGNIFRVTSTLHLINSPWNLVFVKKDSIINILRLCSHYLGPKTLRLTPSTLDTLSLDSPPGRVPVYRGTLDDSPEDLRNRLQTGRTLTLLC